MKDQTLRQPPPANLSDKAFLQDALLRHVLSALCAEGGEARVAGGAVRNALLDLPVRDIDVATTETPDHVTTLMQRAGLAVYPTGVDHGTVTVVATGEGRVRSFEVTTLRRDIETDGRHAKVSFTKDWTADAQRRDFTINALYCDLRGEVLDPLGGYDDLLARRVRFVGNAVDRNPRRLSADPALFPVSCAICVGPTGSRRSCRGCRDEGGRAGLVGRAGCRGDETDPDRARGARCSSDHGTTIHSQCLCAGSV